MLKVADYDIVFAEVPDEVSLAINLSRCPNHCEGCHSPQLWRDIGEPLTHSRLDVLIGRYRSGITCVCFMGGDGDTEALADLADHIRSQFQDLKLAWYSGRPALPTNIQAGQWDYIKLGPYIPKYGPLNRKTTNQRFYRVRDKGRLVDMTARFLKENF